jgi:hypothetical protein
MLAGQSDARYDLGDAQIIETDSHFRAGGSLLLQEGDHFVDIVGKQR